MNSFFGLNTGVKGLYAAQTSLYTTGHNISNAETEGYSRQVTTQKATASIKTCSGMIGTGVEVTTIESVRNKFLDMRYWNENDSYGEWNTKSSSLSEMESIMNELADSSFNDVLSDFLSSLSDLSTDPDSQDAKTVVKEYGNSLCKYLNTVSSNFTSLQEDYNSYIKVKVNEINSYAEQIRDLNEQIYKSELKGSIANDLRDQRALIVDELSEIADVTINEIDTGESGEKFQVLLGGVSLVNHFSVNELECYTIDDGSENDGMYGVMWSKTGQDVKFEGGEIKGYLDMRDGTGEDGEYKGIPYYQEKLNEFAKDFAKAFNEGVYADGTQGISGHANGANSDGTTGTKFFTYEGKSTEEFMDTGSDLDSIYDNITAANISISSDIENDASKIATASLDGESGNNDNINELISMFSDTEVFANGTPEDFYNSIISELGVETSHASRLSSNYENILTQIDNNRDSVSSVSLDEETANLVAYQQAYNAASELISVLNEVLDVTINGLGI